MNKAPIDSKNLGAQNEQLIISLLRQHGKISQTELRKLAHLSSSTTSYIIGRLRKKGMITETRGESRRRGAKPVIMEINPRWLFAVGIEISPTHILLGLFDFNGRLIDSIRPFLESGCSPEYVCHRLEINLRGLLSKYDVTSEKLAGIGVALSGSISSKGVVELSSPLGWKSVPLKKMLQERLDEEVTLCTTRVRLLAETSMDTDLLFGNVLYLNIADGVGSHTIIDGLLLHGATNRSGEIGHIIVDPDGPQCGCGHKGCLEAFISGPALTRKIRADLAAGQESRLADMIEPDDLPETVINQWGCALKEQDPYAGGIQAYLADYFCPLACAMINCFDPDLLILAGYVTRQCYDFLARRIQKRLSTDVYDYEARHLQIKPARAGQEALIRGAARSILMTYSEKY